MRLEDVLPALREGKRIKVSYWPQNEFVYLGPSATGKSKACLYDYRHRDFCFEWWHVNDATWEIVPEPTRVADYLVETPYKRTDIEHYPPTYWQQSTYPIGQQPEGSVLVPNSERNQE